MQAYRKEYIIVALIIGINFLFKLIQISAPSFWYDEIISAQDTLLDFGHIKHEAEWDKNPPFYHYLLWIWSKVFGISELALRSMSAFFSSLTAALVYVFAKKFNTRTIALGITCLFTFHPFIYYFAQEARCFSLLIFLVMLNLTVLYSLVQKPDFIKAFSLGVLNFLIFYTHYLAGMVVFFQFFYIVYIFRSKWIYYLLIYLTPLLLIFIRFTKKQYLVLFFSQGMSAEKQNVPLANFNYLEKALKELFVSNVVFLIYIIFAFLFLYKVFKNRDIPDKNSLFKLFTIVFPLLCIFFLFGIGKWTNVFHERYLIFISPFLIVSTGFLMENVKVKYVFFSCILLFEFFNLKFGQSRRMDYRFCAVLAKQLEKQQDVNILIQTHDVVNLFTYYYDQEVFKSKERMSKEYLAEKGIYYIETFYDLETMKFKRDLPILFFQTYQKKKEEESINEYFAKMKFSRFSTNQIEGVKFSYLKKP